MICTGRFALVLTESVACLAKRKGVSTRCWYELVGLAVTVAPVPVFLLLLWTQSAKIAIGIAMIFARPLMVIDNFVVIPDVVVVVIGIIDTVVMMRRTSRAECERR